MFFNITNRVTYNHNATEKIRNLLFSFFITFLLLVLSIGVIFVIDYIVTSIGFESIRNLISKTAKKHNSLGFLKFVIVLPLIEEILFRIFLIPKKNNLSIFFSVLFFRLANGSFFKIHLSELRFYIALIMVLVSFIVVNKMYKYLRNLILKYNKELIFISITLFGLVHIGNIKTYYWQLTLLYPFYVLPQLIMGYFTTNIRLKYGFIWGIFLHSLINFVGFMLI